MDWVSIRENGEEEIRFTADSASQVSHFRILKKTDPASDYAELTILENTMQGSYLVEDRYPSTDTNQYYMVQALFQPEGCINPIVVTESNVGTSIDLNSILRDQVVYLHWTPYMEYATGLSGYVVQRRNGSGEFVDVATLGAGQNSWEEGIETIDKGYQSGSIQYRVLALSNQVPGADPGLSISRIVQVALETTLKVPSAFTPGSNDMNAEFKPQLDFAPTDYIMVIYDRGGRKLFESTDPSQGWDGSYSGRSFVMEGVYVYHIQYRDHTGKFRTLTGNVAAIYP
jgi:gliding motility-associated-like protein